MTCLFANIRSEGEDQMNLIQDGVQVLCPIGYCKADEQVRYVEDITDCPNGCEICDGDCFYYAED